MRTGGRQIQRFWNYPFLEKVTSVANLYWLFKTQFYYRSFFHHIGKHSKIVSPMTLKNVENMAVGDDVIVNKHVFLLTHPLPGSVKPHLVIGDGCVIGHFNHITATTKVSIGRKVLTADRVHISDNSHIFENPEIAILEQGITSKGPVSIGDGTWIGENASILSCNIGRNCVIGSNAVVIHDIPDYCVAAGAPARIIRRLNPTSGVWERTGNST